jgi:hypothetical protein
VHAVQQLRHPQLLHKQMTKSCKISGVGLCFATFPLFFVSSLQIPANSRGVVGLLMCNYSTSDLNLH